MLTEAQKANALKQALYTEKGTASNSKLISVIEANSKSPSRFSEEHIKSFPDELKDTIQDEFSRFSQPPMIKDGAVTALVRHVVSETISKNAASYNNVATAVNAAHSMISDIYRKMMDAVDNTIQTGITPDDKKQYAEKSESHRKIQTQKTSLESKRHALKNYLAEEKTPKELRELDDRIKKMELDLNTKQSQLNDITVAIAKEPNQKKRTEMELQHNVYGRNNELKSLNNQIQKYKETLKLNAAVNAKEQFDKKREELPGLEAQLKSVADELKTIDHEITQINLYKKMNGITKRVVAMSNDPDFRAAIARLYSPPVSQQTAEQKQKTFDETYNQFYEKHRQQELQSLKGTIGQLLRDGNMITEFGYAWPITQVKHGKSLETKLAQDIQNDLLTLDEAKEMMENLRTALHDSNNLDKLDKSLGQYTQGEITARPNENPVQHLDFATQLKQLAKATNKTERSDAVKQEKNALRQHVSANRLNTMIEGKILRKDDLSINAYRTATKKLSALFEQESGKAYHDSNIKDDAVLKQKLDDMKNQFNQIADALKNLIPSKKLSENLQKTTSIAQFSEMCVHELAKQLSHIIIAAPLKEQKSKLDTAIRLIDAHQSTDSTFKQDAEKAHATAAAFSDPAFREWVHVCNQQLAGALPQKLQDPQIETAAQNLSRIMHMQTQAIHADVKDDPMAKSEYGSHFRTDIRYKELNSLFLVAKAILVDVHEKYHIEKNTPSAWEKLRGVSPPGISADKARVLAKLENKLNELLSKIPGADLAATYAELGSFIRRDILEGEKVALSTGVSSTLKNQLIRLATFIDGQQHNIAREHEQAAKLQSEFASTQPEIPRMRTGP